jgi:Trk-type K+ transport system membrane component
MHRLSFFVWIVTLIFLEVKIKYTWEKLPEFPKITLKTSFFSLCLWAGLHIVIRFLIMPPSWFTSALKAAYDSVSGAGYLWSCVRRA